MATDGPSLGTASSIWVLRTAELPGGCWEHATLLSDHHPDGTVVDPGPQVADFPGAIEVSALRLDELRRPVVSVAPWTADGAPPMWFVEMDASTAARPMHSVVAFASGHLPDGTFVSNAAFFTMPVASDEQVGAVRWDTSTGEIDQIYVDPDARLQHVARKMVVAAAAYGRHRGWAGKVHVGGRRSDTVEAFLKDRTSPRFLPRTERTVIFDPETGHVIP